MIKKIKKKYLEYQAKKIMSVIDEIVYDIVKHDYDRANEKYVKLLKNYKNFDLSKSLELNIIKIHLLFIFNKHDEFLSEVDMLIKMIENSKYGDKYKNYFKGFIFNLKMIVFLFCDNLDGANNEKENALNALDIEMQIKEFDILECQYPIYNENGIKNFFEYNRNYDHISDSKKIFIIDYLTQITQEIELEVL